MGTWSGRSRVKAWWQTDSRREEVRPLYGDEDFQQFAKFGSYIGYCVGISEAGDWLYFVAGE
jgi:hypothetical protein